MGVHLWGRPCFPEQLQQIAIRHNIRLFFDAAHAFACKHSGKSIGNFGTCEVFSFHATKLINTFEGGSIATNDDQLAEQLRLMINFGFVGKDKVVRLGTNAKMSEIHAAMGLACLEDLTTILEINRRNHHQYQESLSALTGIRLLCFKDVEVHNYQYVVIEIDEQAAGVDRDTLMNALHQKGFLARRYFYPGCHNMAPYSNIPSTSPSPLPNTEKLCSQILALPTGTSVTSDDVERVCNLIRSMARKGSIAISAPRID